MNSLFNCSEEESKQSGIYFIENKLTKQFYIGATKQEFRYRWWSHVSHLKANKHAAKHLQNSWNKYGEENFIFGVLEIIEDKNEIERVEQLYLDNLFGDYNTCKVAYLPPNFERTPEYREKISKLHKGKKLSESHRQALLKAITGRIPSEETKQKISESNKGKQKSAEHVAKMVESHEKYQYIITCPDGTVETTRSLSDFCKRHNLSTNFYKYANGEYVRNGKLYKCKPEFKGYKIKRTDLEGNEVVRNLEHEEKSLGKSFSRSRVYLCEYEDKKYEIYSLKDFCKDFNLNYGTVKTSLKIGLFRFTKTDKKVAELNFVPDSNYKVVN